MGEGERPNGAIHIEGQEVKHQGLPQLYELEDEGETDWEAQNWPKVNPSLDAEITGEIEDCEKLRQFIADKVSAAFKVISRMVEVAGKAYAAAPTKVRHLALRAKKRRTRKKNLRRMMREYMKEARRQ